MPARADAVRRLAAHGVGAVAGQQVHLQAAAPQRADGFARVGAQALGELEAREPATLVGQVDLRAVRRLG